MHGRASSLESTGQFDHRQGGGNCIFPMDAHDRRGMSGGRSPAGSPPVVINEPPPFTGEEQWLQSTSNSSEALGATASEGRMRSDPGAPFRANLTATQYSSNAETRGLSTTSSGAMSDVSILSSSVLPSSPSSSPTLPTATRYDSQRASLSMPPQQSFGGYNTASKTQPCPRCHFVANALGTHFCAKCGLQLSQPLYAPSDRSRNSILALKQEIEEQKGYKGAYGGGTEPPSVTAAIRVPAVPTSLTLSEHLSTSKDKVDIARAPASAQYVQSAALPQSSVSNVPHVAVRAAEYKPRALSSVEIDSKDWDFELSNHPTEPVYGALPAGNNLEVESKDSFAHGKTSVSDEMPLENASTQTLHSDYTDGLLAAKTETADAVAAPELYPYCPSVAIDANTPTAQPAVFSWSSPGTHESGMAKNSQDRTAYPVSSLTGQPTDSTRKDLKESSSFQFGTVESTNDNVVASTTPADTVDAGVKSGVNSAELNTHAQSHAFVWPETAVQTNIKHIGPDAPTLNNAADSTSSAVWDSYSQSAPHIAPRQALANDSLTSDHVKHSPKTETIGNAVPNASASSIAGQAWPFENASAAQSDSHAPFVDEQNSQPEKLFDYASEYNTHMPLDPAANLSHPTNAPSWNEFDNSYYSQSNGGDEVAAEQDAYLQRGNEQFSLKTAHDAALVPGGSKDSGHAVQSTNLGVSHAYALNQQQDASIPQIEQLSIKDGAHECENEAGVQTSSAHEHSLDTSVPNQFASSWTDSNVVHSAHSTSNQANAWENAFDGRHVEPQSLPIAPYNQLNNVSSSPPYTAPVYPASANTVDGSFNTAYADNIKEFSADVHEPQTFQGYAGALGYIGEQSPQLNSTQTSNANSEGLNRRPCAVLCFGIGGVAYATFPCRQTRYQASSPDGTGFNSAPNPVIVYRPTELRRIDLKPLLCKTIEKQIFAIGKGAPLVPPNKWVKFGDVAGEALQHAQSSEYQSKDLALLQKLACLMLLHKSIFLSAQQLLPVINNTASSSDTKDLCSALKTCLLDSGLVTNDTLQRQINVSSDKSLVDELVPLLCVGDLQSAVSYSRERKMWTHALLLGVIAQNPALFQISNFAAMVVEFARSELPEGHPIRIMYLLAANVQISPYEFEVPLVANLMCEGPSCIRWNCIAAMLSVNRFPGSQSLLVRLGTSLLGAGKCFAGLFCCLLAGDFAQLLQLDLPLSLLDGSLRAFEMAELAVGLSTPSSLETPISALLLPYKLHNAEMLSDLGLHVLSLRYCDAIDAAVNPKETRIVDGALLARGCAILRNRIVKYAHGKYSISGLVESEHQGNFSWLPKVSVPQLGGLLNVFDRGLTKVIGSEINETVEAETAQKHSAPVTNPSPDVFGIGPRKFSVKVEESAEPLAPIESVGSPLSTFATNQVDSAQQVAESTLHFAHGSSGGIEQYPGQINYGVNVQPQTQYSNSDYANYPQDGAYQSYSLHATQMAGPSAEKSKLDPNAMSQDSALNMSEPAYTSYHTNSGAYFTEASQSNAVDVNQESLGLQGSLGASGDNRAHIETTHTYEHSGAADPNDAANITTAYSEYQYTDYNASTQNPDNPTLEHPYEHVENRMPTAYDGSQYYGQYEYQAQQNYPAGTFDNSGRVDNAEEPQSMPNEITSAAYPNMQADARYATDSAQYYGYVDGVSNQQLQENQQGVGQNDWQQNSQAWPVLPHVAPNYENQYAVHKHDYESNSNIGRESIQGGLNQHDQALQEQSRTVVGSFVAQESTDHWQPDHSASQTFTQDGVTQWQSGNQAEEPMQQSYGEQWQNYYDYSNANAYNDSAYASQIANQELEPAYEPYSGQPSQLAQYSSAADGVNLSHAPDVQYEAAPQSFTQQPVGTADHENGHSLFGHPQEQYMRGEGASLEHNLQPQTANFGAELQDTARNMQHHPSNFSADSAMLEQASYGQNQGLQTAQYEVPVSHIATLPESPAIYSQQAQTVSPDSTASNTIAGHGPSSSSLQPDNSTVSTSVEVNDESKKSPTSSAIAKSDASARADSESSSKRGVFGILTGWFGVKKSQSKDDAASSGDGPKKANLGQSNRFYFDAKLNRWVDPDDDSTSQPVAPPPPPKISMAPQASAGQPQPSAAPISYRRGKDQPLSALYGQAPGLKDSKDASGNIHPNEAIFAAMMANPLVPPVQNVATSHVQASNAGTSSETHGPELSGNQAPVHDHMNVGSSQHTSVSQGSAGVRPAHGQQPQSSPMLRATPLPPRPSAAYNATMNSGAAPQEYARNVQPPQGASALRQQRPPLPPSGAGHPAASSMNMQPTARPPNPNARQEFRPQMAPQPYPAGPGVVNVGARPVRPAGPGQVSGRPVMPPPSDSGMQRQSNI